MKKLIFLPLIVLLLLGCGNSEKKEIISRYENNNPKLIYYVVGKDGKKERVKEEMLYENGKTRYLGEFKNEVPNGNWKYYFETGKPFAQAIFDDTNTMGKDWIFYDETGAKLFPESTDIREGVALDGQHCPTSVAFSKGDLSTHIQFFDDFKPYSKGTTKNQVKEGEWLFYYKNGNLQTKGTFVAGELEGLQEVYYENGQLRYKGNFKQGKRVGIWYFYNEDGNLDAEKNFDEK